MSERVEVREKRQVEIHADGTRVERTDSNRPGRVQLRQNRQVEMRDHGVAVERASSGIVGPAGPTGGLITAIAGIDLSGHRAVVPLPDGSLIYADNATPAHRGLPVWLTTGAVLAGQQITVVAFGEVTEPTWSWSPGELIYLGANGVLTQTPPVAPGFLLELATAPAPDVIVFDPKLPIQLA